MLFDVLKKSKTFFASAASSHRIKPEIKFDELKIFSNLNKYFKKHKEVYKNKATLVSEKKELDQVKRVLFKKYSASGLVALETPYRENTPDYFLSNVKVFSLKSKDNVLAASKVYFEDGITIKASDLIDLEIRNLRSKGYKLAEMTPIAISSEIVKDRSFNPNKNNLFAATLLKTFSGIINYIYQFSNVTHIVVLSTNADKSIYEWLGFKQFAQPIRTNNFPHAEICPMVLDIKKMLSTADKNIAAYLTLINMDILKKEDEISYSENEIIDYFEQYPSASIVLNQLEKEKLINVHSKLTDIFYTKKIRIKHSASYRRETTQFTLNSDDFREILRKE